jgi:hypothetical protein
VGNRQMALIPKAGPSAMAITPYSYPMQTYMGQQMQPMMHAGGFGGFFPQQHEGQCRYGDVAVVDSEHTKLSTAHVCYGCGNLRSRRFQAEHPLEPGETPPISYCRKCFKDLYSTDSEPEGNRAPPRIPGKSKKKGDKDKGPTTAVTLHVCAQCGSYRSNKFQALHPIKQSEKPVPSYCGKCQKAFTSSEGSDSGTSSSGEHSHRNKMHKRGKKQRYKKVSDCCS